MFCILDIQVLWHETSTLQGIIIMIYMHKRAELGCTRHHKSDPFLYVLVLDLVN